MIQHIPKIRICRSIFWMVESPAVMTSLPPDNTIRKLRSECLNRPMSPDLIARSGLGILDLELVHDLLYVWNLRRGDFGFCFFGLGVHTTRQSNDAILDVILYVLVESSLDERGVQIFVYSFIQVRVYCPGLPLCSRRDHGDFISYNLTTGIGLGDRFGL